MDQIMKLNVGDWVKGKSKHGELIYGYVEWFDVIQGVVGVTVVSCDNSDTIGRTVDTLEKWIKKIPVACLDEQQVLQLIEVALQVRDKAWFLELTATLHMLKQGTAINGYETQKRSSFHNRLGKII